MPFVSSSLDSKSHTELPSVAKHINHINCQSTKDRPIMSRTCWAFIGLTFIAGSCAVSEPPVGDQQSVAEQAISSEGPFTDTQALVNYWVGTSTGNALTQIYVNGRKVYERSGFGPAFVKQYFACSGGGTYAICPTGFFDGYSDFNTLISRSPTTATIYKDSVLFRSGTNRFESENISTCSGDQSFYGTITYYKVISYSSGFVPYFANCYP
jgi:hypothetical protein